MPNTLVHLGLQGLVSRTILRIGDLKWIYLGCILPDVPWIMQRVLKITGLHVPMYDLALYTGVQGSLCFNLVLAAAVAAVAIHFGRVFAILAVNAFLHLALDALEVKGLNGVLFLAPISWKAVSLEWLKPESIVMLMLTAYGLVYVVWNWRKAVEKRPKLDFRNPWRLVMGAVLVAAYLLCPLFFTASLENSGYAFIRTLRDVGQRPGKPAAFDRALFVPDPAGNRLRIFTGEELRVDGIDLARSVPVTVEGVFVGTDRILARTFFVHTPGLRDGSVMLGLLLVGLSWIGSMRHSRP